MWFDVAAHHAGQPSPSSRRAGIEIGWVQFCPNVGQVALLAEGGDRNNYATYSQSLARVALLAEGGDRNMRVEKTNQPLPGRPPRGGRG